MWCCCNQIKVCKSLNWIYVIHMHANIVYLYTYEWYTRRIKNIFQYFQMLKIGLIKIDQILVNNVFGIFVCNLFIYCQRWLHTIVARKVTQNNIPYRFIFFQIGTIGNLIDENITRDLEIVFFFLFKLLLRMHNNICHL